jgi:hypothetical protein
MHENFEFDDRREFDREKAQQISNFKPIIKFRKFLNTGDHQIPQPIPQEQG